MDIGNNEDDNERYYHELESNYRNSPYERPDLCEQDEQLVSDYLELLKRKGVYMYEYMNSFDRFQETQLPEQENFTVSSVDRESVMRIISMLITYRKHLVLTT